MSDIYSYLTKNLYVINGGASTNEDGTSSAVASSSSGSSGTGSEIASESIVSGEVDGNLSFIGGFIQSKNFVSGSMGWRLSADGTFEAVNAILSGTIVATSGTIGGFNIGSDYIRDVGNSMGLSSTVTGANDVRFYAGDTYANRNTAPFRVYENGSVVASNIVITGGSVDATLLAGLVPQTNLNIANRGWSQTCVFTVSDADTVAWSGGSFVSADGTVYAISSGNTGDMVAKTYIYLDIGVSTTAYQTTTTAANAVGVGKVLIAIAQNGTGEATFQVLSGQGGQNIDASSIVASSITANEIAAGAITAGKINVSQLSAITADMGAITAGTIVLPSGGYIRSGQTAYDTGTGFYLGNDSGTPKFSIGNSAADKLLWTGTSLEITGNITGSTITGGTFQTAASGERIVISGSTNSIVFYDGATIIGTLVPRVQLTTTGFDMFAPEEGTEGSRIGLLYDPVDEEGIINLYAWDDTISGLQMRFLVSENFTRLDFQTCRIDGDMDPEADETIDLGNSSLKYDNIWCDTIHRTSESSPSDRDLKEDIKPFKRGLDEILKLDPKKFTWKHNGEKGYGFIAQEIKEVIPEMVSPIMEKEDPKRDAKGKKIKNQIRKKSPKLKPNGDPLLSVDYSVLNPILVKAIQDLNKKVEDQAKLLAKNGII